MIPELYCAQCPEWLSTITPASRCPEVDWLLQDSLYYPACGLNGTPVKYLAGNVFSFIYADYGVTLEEFLENLNGDGDECGFKNYECIVQRQLLIDDVVPSGWCPPIVPQGPVVGRLREQEKRCRPFGHWSVWQRQFAAPMEVGPNRFSFLYLAGEMSAIYQGLYCRNDIAPKVLAIIQPGSMDGERKNTVSDDSFFKRVVRSNPAGMPHFLLHGGFGRSEWYQAPCWDDYAGPRIKQLPERYAGLWKLATSRSHEF